jgi:hypothetical protein
MTSTNLTTTNGSLVQSLAVIAGVGALVFGAYQYTEALASYGDAGDQCVKFAEESKISPAFDPDPADKKIFVASKRIKLSGDVVVELGQHTKDKGYYQARLCVIGHGKIQIPSVLEQWEYR